MDVWMDGWMDGWMICMYISLYLSMYVWHISMHTWLHVSIYARYVSIDINQFNWFSKYKKIGSEVKYTGRKPTRILMKISVLTVITYYLY